MVSYRLIHLPEQLVIIAKWCEVEESRPILRRWPHAPPPQCQLQRLAGSRQGVNPVANQLQLSAKHNLHRHRVSRQLYSRPRHLNRPEKNSITDDRVICGNRWHALKVVR